MPLSQSVQDELRAELAAIETVRKQVTQKLDARVDAIRAVLEPFDFNQTALPFSGESPSAPTPTPPVAGDFTARVRATFAAPLSIISGSKFASTGLRAAILGV